MWLSIFHFTLIGESVKVLFHYGLISPQKLLFSPYTEGTGHLNILVAKLEELSSKNPADLAGFLLFEYETVHIGMCRVLDLPYIENVWFPIRLTTGRVLIQPSVARCGLK